MLVDSGGPNNSDLADLADGVESGGGLTRLQRRTLQVIREHIQSRGLAPTIREIGRELGLVHPTGADAPVRALEQKGFITRGGGRKARAIQLSISVAPEQPRPTSETRPPIGVVAEVEGAIVTLRKRAVNAARRVSSPDAAVRAWQKVAVIDDVLEYMAAKVSES